MKTTFATLCALILFATAGFSQDGQEYPIKTIFNNHGPRASGGYGAITNKFTTINGDFAHIVEVYGGWYINHRFLIGVAAAANCNNIPVPVQDRINPYLNTSYEYGQVGLMTEYVIGSDKAVHLAFQLFGGGGFTVQYERYPDRHNHWDSDSDQAYDENWFYVVEPGMKLELNIFRWMRLCPGVSYRAAFKSKGLGLSDSDISGTSIDVTLKFGRF